MSCPSLLVATLGLSLLLVGASCAKRSSSHASGSGSSTPARTHGATPSGAATGTASSVAKVCADLAAQYRRLLASGGRCTRDDECTCTGRGPLGCGEATDAQTGRRAQTLRRLFALARCPVVRRCVVKQRCESARCVAKRCVGAARG